MPRLCTRGLGPVNFTPAVTTGTTFWSALYNYLTTNSNLSGITAVYYRRTPPNGPNGVGPVFPYLIVSPINDTAELNNSETYWDRADIQFSLLGTDDLTVENLGELAYKALAPKQTNGSGQVISRPTLSWDTGKEICALPGWKRRVEQPGRTVANKNVWAYQFGYTFLVARSMV